ncbi:MAG: pilus assembly protein [Blastochloris sp.]|nr:pilus assembly protein [Blastochloris sp.]
MLRRSHGQSVVEMAFVMPLLVLILFGIIDLGYYIYGYSTIYQAARNGAEAAAQLPPYANRISPAVAPNAYDRATDPCINTILTEIQEDATLFRDLTSTGSVTISYPPGTASEPRALSQPIEVSITYNINPLTPVWRFAMMGNNGVMTVQTTARRSIEALGDNPSSPNKIACVQ